MLFFVQEKFKLINRIIGIFLFILIACNQQNNSNTMNKPSFYSQTDTNKIDVQQDKESLKKTLSPELYNVAVNKGTERAFTGQFWDSKEKGTYYCAVCGNPLFVSDAKFESGCGWPSFYEPISKTSVIYKLDTSHGMARTEVMCGRCHSHLGHLFDDGPPPTGLRFCINGVTLDFDTAKEAEKKFDAAVKGEK
jgi:peptide-methionine (R)-S-oxide reductase